MKKKLLVVLLSFVLVVTMMPFQVFAQSENESNSQAANPKAEAPTTNDEDYLSFTATNWWTTLTLEASDYGDPTPLSLSFSMDTKDNWQDFKLGPEGGVTINEHHTVYLKLKEGATPVYPGSDYGHWQFRLSDMGPTVVDVGGNIMSLVSENPAEATTIDEPYAFYCLFRGSLINSAPKLMASKLSENCYDSMFEYCDYLTEIPNIPDSEMAPCSFVSTFRYCRGLKKAPALLAENLAEECYHTMFMGCRALETPPQLFAKKLAPSCYQSMFYDCSSLKTTPELPITQLEDSCYSSMFQGCSSIEKAPALPASKLTMNCYSSMFQGCSSLKETPVLSSTDLAERCYTRMFDGCSSLEAMPELSATKLYATCYLGMFSGCKNLKKTSKLPADIVLGDCYSNMFSNCTSLTEPPEMLATEIGSFSCSNMFAGCTNLLEAPKLPAESVDSLGYYHMFDNCTSLKTAPDLPATQPGQSAYAYMFKGCTSLTKGPLIGSTRPLLYTMREMFNGCEKLNSIGVSFIDWREGSSSTTDWVKGVGTTGTFTCPVDLPQTFDSSHIPEGWNVINSYNIQAKNPKHGTIKAIVDGTAATYALPGAKVQLEYSSTMGYKIDEFQVMQGETPIEVSEDNTFIMPEGNVTVTATELGPYTITKRASHGTITLDPQKESYGEGEVLTLGYESSEGYRAEMFMAFNDTTGEMIRISGNKFTMPASNVTIEVFEMPILYLINIEPSEHGRIDCTRYSYAGDKIKFNSISEKGYELGSIEITDSKGNIIPVEDNSFVMPPSDVNIKSEFVLTNYNINVEPSEHGMIDAPSTATMGETVELTPVPERGFELESVTVTDSEGNPVEVIDNSFTMPASDVNITSEFIATVYSINVEPSEHGTIDVQRTSIAGEIIEFTAIPEEGYRFEKVIVTDSEGNPIPVVDNSFIMPTDNVTISSEFVPIDPEYVPDIRGFETWAPGSKQINVQWEKSSNPRVHYWIYRSTVPYGDWGPAIADVSNNQTLWVDTNIEAGTKYYYLVRGAIKVGDGWVFGDYTKMDYGYPRILDIEHFEAWASDQNRVNLHWLMSKDPNVVYFIYRGAAPSGDWGDAIAILSNATVEYRDRFFMPGVKNYYMARPAVLNNDGTYSFGEYTNIDYAWPR